MTAQERAVLYALAGGWTSPEIAERLGIAVTTVRTHLRSLRDKFGVKTQAGLVAEGVRRGVVDLRKKDDDSATDDPQI